MKSSDSQLKSRGKVSAEDLQQYNNYSRTELTEMLESKEAYERTIAVKLLSEKNQLTEDLIYLFLDVLKQEKKLYTKIQLCDALSKGGIRSARIMLKYLGQIGNNQHMVLPQSIVHKRSYPLPRDIIARTLASMGEEVLDVLMDVVKTNNITAVRETIDAIGYICFYSRACSDIQIIDVLFQCLKDNYDDDIIRWKLVRAFEGFNDINVIKTLMEIRQNDSQLVIREEAQRSLDIINNRAGI